MTKAIHPALYQINTRVWLTELSRTLGRRATLDDIPDAELDRLAAMGIDWIWFLSVWQIGPTSQEISRNHEGWRFEFQATLPDLQEEDIGGSGFAITSYTVHQDLGGNAALARLRERLRKRRLKLMLDFVPNHVGLDHPWIEDHPDYFIQGNDRDLARASKNYTRVQRKKGDLVLAYGRDPYFSGWTDTLQLNFANPELQDAMTAELLQIADQCDGVRCDMAMLILPEVFERTWGQRAPSFWPSAIQKTRQRVPGFLFMAEVYWDMEWTLQQQGFDYAYDKRLYDRLREGHAKPVREHFHAELAYQNKLVRFLENHDELRAATAFKFPAHQAAAVLTYLSLGLRFFHQGQFEGFRKRISPHLVRGPIEPVNDDVRAFYNRLLTVLRNPTVREGDWQLLECEPAWDDNWTNDCFVVFAWQGPQSERIIVAVNYAPNQSQCHVRLPFPELSGKKWQLQDQLSAASFEWNGDDLLEKGLYLDHAPWQSCVFSVVAEDCD